MIVMRSLFEEQIVSEELAMMRSLESGQESQGEARTYMVEPADFILGPDEYLRQLERLKAAVAVPVVASLNGTTEGGWLKYASLIKQAGADGLELNIYELATDLEETGEAVEKRVIQVIQAVKDLVTIPVAVKLSPFYSSMANLAKKLDELRVDGLLLFNRFYQPDIDVTQLEVLRVNLSDSSELLLRLRWLAILFGSIDASLAATGGVHTGIDVVKAMMAGADAVQMVSALLHHGPAYLRDFREELAQWMEENEYHSLKQMQGSMSLYRCPDPRAYERANYMKILQSWQV